MYISQLPDAYQSKIKDTLVSSDLSAKDIKLAMKSKLKDIEFLLKLCGEELPVMSVSMWAWRDEVCDQNPECCCNCDNCRFAEDEEEDDE